MPDRRFPPPWTVEEYRASPISSATPITLPWRMYFESGPRKAANLMTKDEARKIAAGIAKLLELQGAGDF